MAINSYSPEYTAVSALDRQLKVRLHYTTTDNFNNNSSTLTITPQWMLANAQSEDYILSSANSGSMALILTVGDTTSKRLTIRTGTTHTSLLNKWEDIPYVAYNSSTKTWEKSVFTVNIPHYSTTEIENVEVIFNWDIAHQGLYIMLDGATEINYNYGPNSDILGSDFIALDPIYKGAKVLTATAFTDETNPTITYSNPNGSNVSDLLACISLTGGKDDIAYRSISKTGTSYTFNLTEAERNVLRVAAKNNTTIPVRFYLKTIYSYENTTLFNYATQNFTVVNCNPVISNPTVKDVNSTTVALTGNANYIVKYESMAEYSYTPVAMKSATITSQYVQCGNKKVSGLNQGVIDDVESNLFVFSATDSRGLTSQTTITKTLVDYVKPTCRQDVKAELSGVDGGVVNLKISGNYFNGTFGAVKNTLKIEVRHTQNNGAMGDWVDLTSGLIPVFNGTTYELSTTISGFSYSQPYTFQCRATDKLNTVITSQYTVRVLPVFDWSKEDFNFNVPVNINGETVLRHTTDTNNTVLSASGGHIYLRPKGTDDATNEAIIYPDGSVNFTGAVKSGGTDIITTAVNSATNTAKTYTDNKFNPLNTTVSSLSTTISNLTKDYITATGTTAMGSNGTWYWTKWNSGKAECYGCRNFGAMSLKDENYGYIYVGPEQNQALPSGLFINRPDVININIIEVNDVGAPLWITKQAITTAPSATNTGGFYLTSSYGVGNSKPTNASYTYIGFHVIGRWK